MRDPHEFDAFYKATRHTLVLQVYALTGDLPCARSAVRAGFTAAWHHWRKVSRLESPEDWVRPFAWSHAQRSHTGRIWHRDKNLDPGLRATLDALAKLTTNQRKVLLLSRLTDSSLTELARESGLTDPDAARQLAIAVADFAHLRAVEPDEIEGHLRALQGRTDEVRFPRASIIRRAGSARRRAHTGLGIAAVLLTLLVAGTLTSQGSGPTPGADGGRAQAGRGPDREPDPRRLRTRDLLTPLQLATVPPRRAFARVNTDDGTAGDGINVICQRDRYADPDGVAALVRKFDATGSPRMSALQTVELSETDAAARTAYHRTIGWFVGCRDLRVQLISTRAVRGAGDEGTLLVLRSWSRPVTTYSIGVVRTGSIISTVVRREASGDRARVDGTMRLMALSVGGLCDHPGAGACAGDVTATRTAPPPAEESPGMLQVVDLPPIPGVRHPWVGTDPVRPRALNPAATTCDNADFSGRAIPRAATRSFVIPQQNLSPRFGVSQTSGRFRTEKAAGAFVAGIRKRMDSCEDRDLASTVDRLHDHARRSVDMTVWRLTTEISDTRTVEFSMAIIRRGAVVTQVGFTPASGATMKPGDFHDLCDRALERTANLFRP